MLHLINLFIPSNILGLMIHLARDEVLGINQALARNYVLKAGLGNSNVRLVQLVDPKEEYTGIDREIPSWADDGFFDLSVRAASQSFLNWGTRQNTIYGHCDISTLTSSDTSLCDLWLTGGGNFWAYHKNNKIRMVAQSFWRKGLTYVETNPDFYDTLCLMEDVLANPQHFEALWRSVPDDKRKELRNPLVAIAK